ncbi:hypothetical protein QOZ80_2AG0131160 [Eleusine coracana subsp. coracana]|nr:hypothetical protein QOZ80_2AG0131160 [Eleusine coracana subsp. coracana]
MMEEMVLALHTLASPEPHRYTVEVRVEETNEDEPKLLDVFDSVEEYVDVNDEFIYGVTTSPNAQPESVQPKDAQPDNAHPGIAQSENVATSDSGQPNAAGGAIPAEAEVNDIDPQEVVVLHNPENPDIRKGALFPDIITFRKAIRHYAIIKGFKFDHLKIDKTRFLAHCKHEGCPWRIHASRLQDEKTIEIKTLPFEHNCYKGPKAAQENLEEKYEINLKYSKSWSGLKLAGKQVHGTYEESFQLLFNWTAEVERVCPGFILEIDVHKVETDDNWLWFMNLLHRAIENPVGLVISSDANPGLVVAATNVFPNAEHRDCMRRLYANFLKRFRGPVFVEHLYPAARSYTKDKFKWHIQQIDQFSPEAVAWLDKNHGRIWYRCGFSEDNKCDYLTNNISESFNKQIKPLKGLFLHELVDGLRELFMEKMALRRKIGRLLDDGNHGILPSVMMELNKASNKLKVVKVGRGDDDFTEITLVDVDNMTRRHTVDLQNHKCSCRKWQITGKPCDHALAWICANRGNIADYGHDNYSVQRFRAAYAGMVPPMIDRTQWPVVDLGYKLYPPRQKRGAGRPRVGGFVGFLNLEDEL